LPKETGNPLFYTRAGLSGQRPITITVAVNVPKNTVPGTSPWVFSGISLKSQNARAPKNVIDTGTAFSFEFKDRSGVTMFFEHANFQPRASKAQKKYFIQNGLCPSTKTTVHSTAEVPHHLTI
jgi:hypothetical protein